MVILLLPLLEWLFIFFTVGFGFLYLFLTWDYDYWKKRSIPHEKPVFPFGNIWSLMTRKESFGEFYRSSHLRFKGHRYMGYIMLREPNLMLRDPGLIKRVLVKDFSHFHDRGTPVDEINDPISGTLFRLAGSRWHSLRNKLSPSFTSGKMKYMFPIIQACVEQLQKTMSNEVEKMGGVIEMKDIMARYATDIIGSTAFGVDVGSLENPDSKFRMIGRRITAADFGNSFRAMMTVFAPALTLKLGIKSIDPVSESYFSKIVEETVNYREQNSIKRADFLQLLIGLRAGSKEDNDKGSSETDLTMEQLIAQCFVFFVGGFETSSSTLTFTLYELSKNLDIQQQLREEVDRVLEEHGGQITYDGLAQMHYMDCVISESQRIYPPAPVLLRECTKEWKIPSAEETGSDTWEWKSETRNGGHVVEVGTIVHIPLSGLHLDPEYFKDPEIFNPERFTEEGRKHWPPFAFLPFGEGPRICIGMRFGNMQTKAGLAALLSKFEFRPSTKSSDPLVMDKMAFFPNVKDGVWLQASERTFTSKESTN